MGRGRNHEGQVTLGDFGKLSGLKKTKIPKIPDQEGEFGKIEGVKYTRYLKNLRMSAILDILEFLL